MLRAGTESTLCQSSHIRHTHTMHRCFAQQDWLRVLLFGIDCLDCLLGLACTCDVLSLLCTNSLSCQSPMHNQTKCISFLWSKIRACKHCDADQYVHLAVIWQVAPPGLQAHASCKSALIRYLGHSADLSLHNTQSMSFSSQVRWLQQAEAGTLAPEDEEDEDVQDYAAFDIGPPGKHHYTPAIVPAVSLC